MTPSLNSHALTATRREGKIEQGLKRLKDVGRLKMVYTGHVVPSEAELMIGKMMTSPRTVLSAEERPRQRHHKSKTS